MNSFQYDGYKDLTDDEVHLHISEIISKIKTIASQYATKDNPYDDGYNGVIWFQNEIKAFEDIYFKYRTDYVGLGYVYNDCINMEEISEILYEHSNCYIYFCNWFFKLGGKRNREFQKWSLSTNSKVYL